jgi:hypothetical protein
VSISAALAACPFSRDRREIATTQRLARSSSSSSSSSGEASTENWGTSGVETAFIDGGDVGRE